MVGSFRDFRVVRVHRVRGLGFRVHWLRGLANFVMRWQTFPKLPARAWNSGGQNPKLHPTPNSESFRNFEMWRRVQTGLFRFEADGNVLRAVYSAPIWWMVVVQKFLTWDMASHLFCEAFTEPICYLQIWQHRQQLRDGR